MHTFNPLDSVELDSVLRFAVVMSVVSFEVIEEASVIFSSSLELLLDSVMKASESTTELEFTEDKIVDVSGSLVELDSMVE